jgi:ferredoxin
VSAKGFETDTGVAVAPVARRSDGFDEEATVVMAAEPNSPAAAQTENPRRSLGLGARLRRLGRRFEGPGGNASDSAARSESGTRVIRETSREQSDAIAESVPERGELEGESALEAGKCLLVLDSDGGGVSLEAAIGQTILEAVQEAGLTRGEPVDWECGDGGCGVCVMGVVEGADRLDPPDPATGEMRTIQITEQVVPDPTQYRLACLARVRGTVRLRKLI